MGAIRKPKSEEPAEDPLAQLLVERGILSPPEYELVRRQCRATGRSVRQIVLSLSLADAGALDRLEAEKRESTAPTEGSPTAEPTEPTILPMSTRTPATAGSSPPFPRSERSAPEPTDFVEQILRHAIELRATDVHFDPQEDGRLRVRARVDGQLSDLSTIPEKGAASLISRIKILAGMDIMERRDAQDGQLRWGTGEQRKDVRVATLPTRDGERLVLRILDRDRVHLGLDGLGMEEPQVETLRRLVARPFGILPVAGPVGVGKTTTLYACLAERNLPSLNVVTIEDPVEYRLDGVNQAQVDPRNEWTFLKALRATLRQDPDVLMVGEIRDEETAGIAVRASLTGILVLTSLHAGDAAGAIGTFVNYGVPGFQLAAGLIGVVSQRLVRRLDSNFTESYEPDPATRTFLGLADDEAVTLRRPRSDAAPGQGYRGRTGVFEVLEMDEALRDLVFRGAPKAELRRTAIANGMVSLAQHASHKVIAGETTLEEAARVALL